MKSFALLPIFLMVALFSTAQPKPAATGYDIKLSIKPYKNQWLYLAYYYGSIKGLADSAWLDANSKGDFKGKTKLPQGIYIVASPSKTILFEMLMGENQQFSISADTVDLDKSLAFSGSSDNQQFMEYTKYIAPLAKATEEARVHLTQDSTASEDSKAADRTIIEKNLGEIDTYRKNFTTEHPNTILSVLFNSMQEVKFPEELQHPVNRADSLAQYRFGKEHYWDGIDFMDGRLVRTPIFENKLKTYLNNWVVPDADSLIYEFNWMIALGRNDPEMFKYLIGYFVDNYMYPKIMGQDKVFLHVYQRYLSGDKPIADWLNEKQMKTITDRAYMIMANQLGTQAWDMQLKDTSGKQKSLYNVQGDYTVVAFWDVHCGKCREEIPRIDTLYRTKWQKENVKIYAVMVNEESLKDWPAFIKEHAAGWVHVHQPADMRADEEKAGKPNFRQLYDMRSTPTLYLLDKDKRIIAKNIGVTDLDNVIQEKSDNKKQRAKPSPKNRHLNIHAMINKLLTCFTAGLFFVSTSPAQTLFTYGTKTVSKDEFVRAFEKNPEPGDRRKAMEAYLPLFINYKLKVQDALDKKMDTLPGQIAELNSYRDQLVENYINNKANTKELVKEAFENSQKDILLGHLFISFNPADSASMKEAAAQAAKAREALESNNDFVAVVNQYSNDEAIKASGGKAGWITAFSIPYVYEKAIYDLPVGGYSKIFKSPSGFHIFRKIKERPARGKVQVAQILLVNTEPGNSEIDAKNKRLADSLYQLLQNGAAFDSLALQFSNDRTSYNNGGILPEFGVGTYDEQFEQEAFDLHAKGDVSKPFKTAYGWHMLKLLNKTPVPSTMEEADMNNQLSEKVLNSGRAGAARNTFLQEEMPKLKFKPAPINSADLWQFTDSAITSGNTKGQKVTNKTPLFSFGNTAITADQWLQYAKSARFAPGGETKTYADLLKEFTLAKELEYLHKNLPAIDHDFDLQFREFKDANLLFEAMDKNVWNKASLDTAGLNRYYKEHKTNYRWGQSATAILVTCTDSSIVDNIRKAVKDNPASWRELQEKFSENIIADSGRYELSQLPVGNTNSIQPGMLTDFVKNDLDGSQTFAYIIDLLPADEQRSFEDAKGFVINDYQQVLEKKWIDSLKKKYPVTINQPVWNKLLASL